MLHISRDSYRQVNIDTKSNEHGKWFLVKMTISYRFISLVAWILVDESWIMVRRSVSPDILFYLPDLWDTGCNVLAFCDCLDCVIMFIDCPMALFAERGFLIDERSTCGRLFPSLIQLWHKTEQWIHFNYHDKKYMKYLPCLAVGRLEESKLSICFNKSFACSET